MRFPLALAILLIAFSSCTNKIYIVRHAEKAAASGEMMSKDPDLSEAGKARAADLSARLSKARIKTVFVTKTVRSSATAGPAAAMAGVKMQVYNGNADTSFIRLVRQAAPNVLIVGHSNTVDDLVNRISGKQVVAGDLSENTFDRLYIIKVRKSGKVTGVRSETYGTPAP